MLKVNLDSLVGLFCADNTETLMHLHSTKAIMGLLCTKLALSQDEMHVAGQAAFYHDVGKVFFRSITCIGRPLSASEYHVIKCHTTYGAKALLECTSLPKEVVETAHYHHERYDGSGYYSLTGIEIPKLSRIMAVVDVYDAIRGARSYHPSADHLTAINKMYDDSRAHDPEVFSVFNDIPHGELDDIVNHFHNEETIKRMIEEGTVSACLNQVL